MIAEVFLAGKRLKLDPARAIGQGGEADVYDIGDGRALKVFKSPDHPDYQGLPSEQRAAEERIAVHQRKLREFPVGLPSEVVAPAALATDRSGKLVLGYAMPLVRGAVALRSYVDPAYRRSGASSAAVVQVFEQILSVVERIHAARVLIGDFNDVNVLVASDSKPRLIDADSFQFGAFRCSVFTEAFVDPLLCDATSDAPRLTRPYDAAADWYAFNALLFQSLLFVGPYGGIYRPKNAADRISHRERPLKRITVFHPDVQYPKPAANVRVLPDELLHHFHRVFERDVRGPFPPHLLEELAFTTCSRCGTEHARALCPICFAAGAPRPAPKATHDALRVETLFRTEGFIVCACIERGELRVVHHEDGVFRREDRSLVLRGALDWTMRIRVRGGNTLVGKGREVAIVSAGSLVDQLSVDGDGSGPPLAGMEPRPAFDANERHHYWVHDGHLWRDGSSAWPSAPEMIGDVLADQTRIFVGPRFGLGLYRAGTLTRAFVFDAEKRGVNDDLRLPQLRGELIEATAVLDEIRAWLLVSLKDRGRVRNVCFVYGATGKLEASAEADPGDGTWLSTLRGKCATAGVLFAATDEGIVRVEIQNGVIEATRRFTETSEYVDGSGQLLVGRHGLCVVRSHDVITLELTQSP